MTGLPDDLRPLPTAPYEERPDSLPLDVDECRTAIWMAIGNITEAAAILKVPSARLRRFVKGNAMLRAEVEEASEQLVDKAESVVMDALRDPERADPMARFVLGSKGKSRGWGQQATNLNITPQGNISISWENGDTITLAQDEPKTIEGDFKDVSE